MAEGIASAKALTRDLTFLEYWINDVNFIYFSSFCSHQLSSTKPSLAIFIGPIDDTMTERSFWWLPHWVPRAPKKFNCSLLLSPLIFVTLLTKSHLLMIDNMDENDISSTLFHNYCVLHIKDADKVSRRFKRGMISAGTSTAHAFNLSSDSLHSEQNLPAHHLCNVWHWQSLLKMPAFCGATFLMEGPTAV